MAPLSLFLATEPVRAGAPRAGPACPFAPPTPQEFAKQLKETVLRGLCTGRSDKEKA